MKSCEIEYINNILYIYKIINSETNIRAGKIKRINYELRVCREKAGGDDERT